MAFSVEPASWRDLNSVRRVEQVCFPKDMWPLWDILGVLTLPNVVRLKAVVADELVGFIAGDIRRNQNLSWIATVGVLPEYRSQGIGRSLMGQCEANLPTPAVRLNVRVSNTSAIRLYETLGYRRIGIWHGYYQDGEDALVMEKMLKVH